MAQNQMEDFVSTSLEQLKTAIRNKPRNKAWVPVPPPLAAILSAASEDGRLNDLLGQPADASMKVIETELGKYFIEHVIYDSGYETPEEWEYDV